MVMIFFIVPGMLLALEPVKVMKPVYYQRDWRLSLQNANIAAREFQKYNCCSGLATKIETELKLNEKTMIAAEKLLSKIPINRQAGKSIVGDISNQIKNLENSMEEVRNKRQEFMTAFENFDQKATQLFNILSTVLKNQKEMETAITRNMN
jgi:predicted ribosome quality control (RQC) complex YloA/Tae2 family protein